MKLKQIIFLLVFGPAGADQEMAAIITWDGGGGDFSWQNAANWNGDVLPSLNDDVVINVPSNITVTSSASVTILSVQCSNNLALSAGTFRCTRRQFCCARRAGDHG